MNYNLILGLLLLMGSNITLGSIDAIVSGGFDKQKLIKGIIKSVFVALSFYMLLLAGQINPDIIAISFNEVDLTLLGAINLLITTACITYGFQVIDKFSTMLGIKSKIEFKEK